MIRIISVNKYNAHTEPIFKLLKLLKVMDILKLQELKYKNTKLFHYLQSMPFDYNSETHQHKIFIQQTIHLGNTDHRYATKYNIHLGNTAHRYATKCINDILVLVINTIREM